MRLRAVVLGGVVAMLTVPGTAEAKTATHNGVRWSTDAKSVSITLDQRTPKRIRDALRGHRVIVGCIALSPSPKETITDTQRRRARFPRGANTLRLTFAHPMSRVDGCFVEAQGAAEDVTAVSFTKRYDDSPYGGI